MSADKQIEEMAQEIRAVKEYIGDAYCTIGERRVGESHSEKIARHLIEEKGYRKAEDIYEDIYEGRIEIVKIGDNDKLKKASDVAREIFEETMQAIEKGVAEGSEKIINSLTNEGLRALLIPTGEAYAGYIGKAICEVFKKYTEDE